MGTEMPHHPNSTNQIRHTGQVACLSSVWGGVEGVCIHESTVQAGVAVANISCLDNVLLCGAGV